MFTRKFTLGLLAALTLATTAYAHDPNPVTYWNTVAIEAFSPSQGTNPLMQSRTFAILHAAIHDAVNAIDRHFKSYTPGLAAAPRASVDAAVAAAAREILVTSITDQTSVINAAYDRALATVPDGPAKTAGISTGRAAAMATLNRRNGDGHAEAAREYVPQSGPGAYQFTAPFTFALLPGWGNVRPFVIDLEGHSVEGPQALTSAEYVRDVEYLKAIGAKDSSTRTPEQTEIARFWYEDSPLGWNRVANAVIRQRKLDPWAAARAFALVNFAVADGYIAGFDAKYRFNFWRPVTAIRATSDPSWEPLMTTPPVPDYPSTHTVAGWAAAEVLIQLLGDKAEFTTTSLTLPGVTRHYSRISTAAEENGLSRIYAGIHFQHAVKDGKQQGRSIGRTAANALGR